MVGKRGNVARRVDGDEETEIVLRVDSLQLFLRCSSRIVKSDWARCGIDRSS